MSSLRLLFLRAQRCRFVRIVRALWLQIDRNDLFTHVAALTYTTVLSVVPLLALLMAVGRGFGLDRYLETQLRANLSLPDHIVGQLMDFANSYISRTQDDVVVGVSFFVLAFTLISLVNNIERRFNAMWGIHTSRSLFSFSLSYLGLIVFLIFSIFFLSGVWVIVLKLLNYLPHFSLVDDSAPVVSWVVKAIVAGSVFALMFKFIPLAPMRWRSVGFPALLTGTLFCAVQDLYVNSQLFLSSYNAIYGSFAILPLLMLWLYVTWSICLGGVALSCVIEQQTFLSSTDDATPQLSRQADDVVALRMMGLLARRFLDGNPSLPLHHLARELQLPVDVAFRARRRGADPRVVDVEVVRTADDATARQLRGFLARAGGIVVLADIHTAVINSLPVRGGLLHPRQNAAHDEGADDARGVDLFFLETDLDQGSSKGLRVRAVDDVDVLGQPAQRNHRHVSFPFH